MRGFLRVVGLCLVLLLPQLAYPQTSWLGRPVTEYVRSLSESGLPVIFSSGLLPESLTVLAEPPGNDPVADLRAVLRPYGLALREGPGGRLLVVRGDCAPGALRVEVVDELTLAPVADARVRVGNGMPQSTNDAGRVELDCLPVETTPVTVLAEGYRPSTVTGLPAVDSPGEVRATLSRSPEPLPEIVVSSSVYNLAYRAAGSHRFLDSELTTRLPDLGDEALRSIDRLPGTANGGVSTQTHVRGGIGNEQLILLDGLRLYEPFHLKDFLSFSTIVDQSAISGIDFYSAGYPARYGDRISGVIDIGLRDPPAGIETELGLSFFNTSALSAGRFGDEGQGDWLVSARRGNLDLVSRALKADYGTPVFQDIFAHLGRRIGERNYLSANLLYSYDKITLADGNDVENARARYQNVIAWLKAETGWTDSLSSTTIVSITDIANQRDGGIDNPGIVRGTVQDDRDFQVLGLKQDWLWAVSDDRTLRTGFDVKHLRAAYRYRSEREIEPPFAGLLDNEPLRQINAAGAPQGNQYAAYGELRWRPADRLILDFGLRWDRQTYTTSGDDDQLSPRFNALFSTGERTDLRLGVGRFSQAQEINELQFIDGVSQYFPASRATHYVLGVDHEFENGVSLEFEIYRKQYDRLYPRFENILDPLILLPDLQIDRARIDASEATAQGAELMLSAEHDSLGLQWWASYGWSETTDRVGGRDVPRSWDQTHTIKGGIGWDWREWSFTAAGNFHSGWPRTAVFVEPLAAGDGSQTFDVRLGPRNGDRWSGFQSLDVRASRRIPLRKGELTVFLEITNLYNRENPCCLQFERSTDDDGNDVLQVDQRYWLPLVPSVGVLWRF